MIPSVLILKAWIEIVAMCAGDLAYFPRHADMLSQFNRREWRDREREREGGSKCLNRLIFSQIPRFSGGET